jgi:hypothetical protein
MNSELAQDINRLEKIVSTITGRDIRSNSRDHKNVIARSIFYKIAYDFLKRSGCNLGAKSYIAKYIGKNHATVLHALKNFDRDINPYAMNRKMYDKSYEVFQSLADTYTTIDDRDVEIDNLKNKMTELQLQLKEAKPYRQEVETLVDLVNTIPEDKIDDAFFRITVMIKGFAIEPRNQETEIIGSYETVTGS